MPKLTDPGEMDTIREMYFEGHNVNPKKLDGLPDDERNMELLDRENHRQSTENQAR